MPTRVVDPSSFTRTLPSAVGRYRVLSLLGEGGMGTVYLAEQSQPHRQIALKVIRRDLAGPRLLRRFEREAEVLGRLQHPGIAQVYEAGTADGPEGPQPYIAMERVTGVPLTEHPHARGPVRGRVALVLQVCDAVHYAHQRGVIHRDLKPGNVLVDAEGRARVLDFGIARRVDADAGSTATGLGEVLGSLAYMSPEQVSGDPLDVDVRSDVYALGVLLHELLAGRRPLSLEGQSFPSAMRIILNVDPPRLGTLDPALAGDLETIVAKALEKEKEHRYASAAALADDLRRYLADEPIAARPASAVYQLRKFARRNRALVGGAGLAVAALVLGTVVSTWQAVRATAAERAAEARRGEAVAAREQAVAAGTLAEARRLTADSARDLAERERAEAERARGAAETSAETARREAAKAEAVNAFLGQMLASGDPDAAQGRAVTVGQVVDQAARRLAAGSLRGQPEVEAAVRTSLANTYAQVGDLDSAYAQAERARALDRATRGPTHPAVARNAYLAGTALYWKGDYKGALARHEEAVRILSGRESRDSASNEIHVSALTQLGHTLYSLGRLPDAERRFREAVQVARRDGARERPALARALGDLGYFLSFALARYDDAIPLLREARAVARTAPESVDTRVAEVEASLLYTLLKQNRRASLPEAVSLARAALARVPTLYRNEPRKRSDATFYLGVALTRVDSLDAAEPHLRESVALRVGAYGETHPLTAFARAELGKVQFARGRHAAAESLFTLALAGRRASLGEKHPVVAASLEDLARLAYARRDTAGGIAHLLQAAELQPAAAAPRAADLASAAEGALTLGRLALADSLANVVATRDADAGARPLTVALALEVRGRVAAARADSGAAAAAWLGAYARLRDQPDGDVGRDRARIAGRLAALYARQGRAADAATWRAREQATAP